MSAGFAYTPDTRVYGRHGMFARLARAKVCETFPMADVRLPVYILSPCTCGHRNQGTRAQAGNSVPCTSCGTRRRVPAARPLTGPDDPRALRTPRGRSFEPGNQWRFQPDEQNLASNSSVAPVVYGSRPPKARQVVTQRPGKTVNDYVTDYTPHITVSESPLPFHLPPVYMRCSECAGENRKNSQGRYNQAGMNYRAWDKENGALLGEGNLCEPCYLKVLKIWSQHRSKIRFRFSTDLRPGL